MKPLRDFLKNLVPNALRVLKIKDVDYSVG